MSNLLSASEITEFQNSIRNHFDTFTYDRTRTIVINKEPLKTIQQITAAPVYGYGGSSNLSNVIYTPVSGVFPAMTHYSEDQDKILLEDVKNALEKGEVRIKVEQDARDFIDDGRKTENIQFDGAVFDIITAAGVQSYLGLVYYIYQLERTS